MTAPQSLVNWHSKYTKYNGSKLNFKWIKLYFTLIKIKMLKYTFKKL